MRTATAGTPTWPADRDGIIGLLRVRIDARIGIHAKAEDELVTRRLTLLYVVTALLTSPAFALDESFEQSFGKNRVKIQRLEAPKEVSQSKLETARARYKSQMKICRGKADRQKQYCMQEAENQLMIDERKIRQRARAEDAAREGGGS